MELRAWNGSFLHAPVSAHSSPGVRQRSFQSGESRQASQSVCRCSARVFSRNDWTRLLVRVTLPSSPSSQPAEAVGEMEHERQPHIEVGVVGGIGDLQPFDELINVLGMRAGWRQA